MIDKPLWLWAGIVLVFGVGVFTFVVGLIKWRKYHVRRRPDGRIIDKNGRPVKR